MTIKDLIEKFKLKGKTTAAIVGMSAALSATAVGCGQKEVVVDNSVKTESVDETAVIEEETKEETVVEEPVVTTPEEVTPVVEEIAITPVTVEQAETRIAELTAAYPNEDAKHIRINIALLNKPYFENESDYLAVMGLESASELMPEDIYYAVCSITDSVAKTALLSSTGMDVSSIDEDLQKMTDYNNQMKISELVIPEELKEAAGIIDESINVLVYATNEERNSSEEFRVAADNLCSITTGIIAGSETKPYSGANVIDNIYISYINNKIISITNANAHTTVLYYSSSSKVEEASDPEIMIDSFLKANTK